MAKKKDAAEERIVAVEEALSKTEQFIESNQKVITIVVAVIVLIVVAFFAFKRFYISPREQKAQAAMFMAEKYFEKDSLDLALFGDGYYKGFLDIIDDYGITASANLSHYYAGICYYRKGEYDEAIHHLRKFKGNDQIVAGMALGVLGDAYLQQGNLEAGVDYYMRAALKNENEFITPAFLLKAGMTYKTMENWDEALQVFERIKEEYPKSREAREVDRYIALAKLKLGQS
ncbi:MAG: tetratricopeptide repeat protein [Bacteroidales bacterium]|nr:tetratricopeptide repeat protein [Bacteroidales bacterium]